MTEDGIGADRVLRGDRSPRRVAQGVGVLALLVLGAGFFLAGNGFGGVATPATRDLIGQRDTDVEVDGTWTVEGIAYVDEPVGLVAGPNVLAMVLPRTGPPHNVVIEQDGVVTTILQAQEAGRYVATVDLAAGPLTYWCSVGTHRQTGMEGSLDVG